MMMGSQKQVDEEEDTAAAANNIYYCNCKISLLAAKRIIAFLGYLSISIGGGVMLTLWGLRFHPTNSQLWMVPLGLILLITPLIIWSSIFISNIFSNSNVPFPAAAAADQENSAAHVHIRRPYWEEERMNPIS